MDQPPDFVQALELAQRLFSRVAARDWRSHRAIRMMIAALGIAVRHARYDPDITNSLCRKRGIKGKRLEVRVVRLVAGTRVGNRSDQVARWANAAAYVACPPNGDEPPPTWRDAIRYINRRGGMRNLSDLYGSRIGGFSSLAEGVGFYDSLAADTTTEWFTPSFLFDAMGIRFDLDPASPGRRLTPWIPANRFYTTYGLEREWFGTIWLNPPYGREVLPLWLAKFAQHRNGVALVPERTSTNWWQELVAEADLILCLNRKIAFASPSGERTTAFPIGSILVAFGERGIRGLVNAHHNGLGLLLTPVRSIEAALLNNGVFLEQNPREPTHTRWSQTRGIFPGVARH